MDEMTTLKTAEWTQTVKENAFMQKALEHLVTVYHRAIDEHLEGVPIRDITDVLEIAEAEKEVEVIA